MQLISGGVLSVGVLIASMSAAAAQARATGGDIRGHVADTSGARLPSAAVTARNRATNIVRDVARTPTAASCWRRSSRASTTCAPSTRAFRRRDASGWWSRSASVVEVTFVLQIARVEQTVRVEAAQPLVNPSQTAVSTVIGRHEIEELPLNGRRFIELAALAAGVTTGGPVDPAAETSGLSVLGQRPVANNLMVDGLDNNDRILGGPSGNFSQEAVARVPGADRLISRGVRQRHRRHRQHRHQSGLQQRPRHGVSLLPRHRAQRPRLLRAVRPVRHAGRRAEGDVQADAVRRIVRRAAAARPHVPVRRVREDADAGQQRRHHRRRGAAALGAAGFPVETGLVPYEQDPAS